MALYVVWLVELLASNFAADPDCWASKLRCLQVVTLRKKYIPAYVKCLQSNQMGGDESIEAMDGELPEHTILVFRRLAHTKVRTGF